MAIKTIPRTISGTDGEPVWGKAVTSLPPRSSEVDVTTGASWPTEVVVAADGCVVDELLVVSTAAVVVDAATLDVVVVDVSVDSLVDVVVGGIVVVVVVVGGIVVVVVVVDVLVVGGLVLPQNWMLEMAGSLPLPTRRPALEKCTFVCAGE
jgi:hypothetical protein